MPGPMKAGPVKPAEFSAIAGRRFAQLAVQIAPGRRRLRDHRDPRFDPLPGAPPGFDEPFFE